MKINYKTNENHFRIKYRGVISLYYLNQVTELNIIKQRDLSLNITLLGSSIISLNIGIFISEIFEPVRIISFFSAALFFLLSTTQRAHNYYLVMTLRNNRRIKLYISDIELEDVMHAVCHINKALRTEDDHYSFTSNEMSEATILRNKFYE